MDQEGTGSFCSHQGLVSEADLVLDSFFPCKHALGSEENDRRNVRLRRLI
jgi:hypothetical protein